MRKRYFLLFSSTLCASTFILGRVTATKYSKKQISSNSAQVEQERQIIQSHQEVKKDSTIAKQMIIKKKIYAHNGKLKEDLYIVTNFGIETSVKNMAQSFSIADVKKTSLNESQTTIIPSIKSNWVVLTSYEIEKQCLINFCANNFSAGIGYRLIDDLYIAAQSNATFNKFQINAIYSF